MSTYDSIPSSQVAAGLGSGVGVDEVISWQASRSLSGGGLPQQARAVSGSSVGSGSVTLIPDAPGESPWSVNATVPGEAVSIDASADVGAPVSPIARMVSRDVSADGWLSPVRTLSIEDEVPRGQALIPEGTGAVDASRVIEDAAAAGGYFTMEPSTPGTILALPLATSLFAGRGEDAAVVSGSPRFEPVGGLPMLTGATIRAAFTRMPPAEAIAIQMWVAVPDPSGSVDVRIVNDLGNPSTSRVGVAVYQDRIEVSAGSGSPRVVPVPGGVSGRRHVAVFVTGVIRTVAVDGEVLDGWPQVPLIGDVRGVRVDAAGGFVSGLHVRDDWDPSEVVTPGLVPNAIIFPALSPLVAVAEPTSGDAWGVIQQVAAATLGAAWIDEEGRLVYRNRDQLRGGVPQYTIDALDHLEDVPWSISTDELADRVEFTYRPPTVSIQANDSLTVWQSTETVRVAAGATVRLDRDIDGAASGLAPWYRVEDTSPPVTRMSRYAAWTAPPGESGSAPPASALAVSSQMLTPTRIRVTIRNTTSAPLWVYELIARARIHVAPGADITIARGLPESKAQRPLQINAGSWVQDDTTANQIADWLESQSAMPLPTIPPVRVIPDASRRLGDVVRVRIGSIGDHEPVVFKALITSIDNSQSAGTYEQRIGFTILAVTFDDWMRWGQALGIDTFDALASHLSHLTSFDQLDHWLTNLGGDL